MTDPDTEPDATRDPPRQPPIVALGLAGQRDRPCSVCSNLRPALEFSQLLPSMCRACAADVTPPPADPDVVAHFAVGVAQSQTRVKCPKCEVALPISPEVFGYVARCDECTCEFVVKPPGAAAKKKRPREHRRAGADPWFDDAVVEPYRVGNPSLFLFVIIALIMIMPSLSALFIAILLGVAGIIRLVTRFSRLPWHEMFCGVLLIIVEVGLLYALWTLIYH